MNSRKISKYFNFLRDYNFYSEQFSNGVDYEINYRKNDVEINVIYAMGFPTEYVKDYIKDGYYEFPVDYDRDKLEKLIEDTSRYGVHVVITKGEKRSNIFECELFDKQLLNELKNNIYECNGDLDKELEVYGAFLKEYIIKIL